MPSNGTYVCLTCRTTKRKDMFHSLNCTNCHQPMVYIGKHWRVPKKKDDDGWTVLAELVAKKHPDAGI